MAFWHETHAVDDLVLGPAWGAKEHLGSAESLQPGALPDSWRLRKQVDSENTAQIRFAAHHDMSSGDQFKYRRSVVSGSCSNFMVAPRHQHEVAQVTSIEADP